MIGFLLFSVVLAGTGLDPAALILRLGAERFDDRVAAYKALEQLGGAALPALRAAVDAGDPRVRARVHALLDAAQRQAERDRFLQPTMVSLEFHDQPLGAVVDSLNNRHDLGMALRLGPALPRGAMVLDPGAPARMDRLRGRTLTLEAPRPVPLWEAVDGLCEAAALHYDVWPRKGFGSGQGAFILMDGRSSRGPVSDSGPFRVQITRIHLAFDRDFRADADPLRQGDRPRGTRALAVTLIALPEPGLALYQAGPLKIEEALDDQGRTLVPPAHGAKEAGTIEPIQWSVRGTTIAASFELNAPLEVHDPPGTKIRRLRGKVPVVAVCRGSDPVVIPLKDEAVVGKPISTRHATIVVDQLALAPGSQSSVWVTVRPLRGDMRAGARDDPRRLDFTSFQLDQVTEHLELYDANGRKIGHGIGEHMPGRDSSSGFVRFRLAAQPAIEDGIIDGNLIGPRPSHTPVPAELRYYEHVQKAMDIPFDFRDVPMP